MKTEKQRAAFYRHLKQRIARLECVLDDDPDEFREVFIAKICFEDRNFIGKGITQEAAKESILSQVWQCTGIAKK